MEYNQSRSYSSLEPGFGAQYTELFTGYGGMTAGKVGASTSPQTSNQLAEVEARLKEGMSVIEYGSTQEEIFEGMPTEQFRDINRLAKLSGAKMSMHAPIIDPSGFGQQGWSEQARSEAERKLLSVVQRSHLANPEGNMPITIHASSILGTEWNKELSKQMPKKMTKFEEDEMKRMTSAQRIRYKKNREQEWEKQMMVVVNQESGEITGAPRDIHYDPETGKKEVILPRERMEMLNLGEWRSRLMKISDLQKEMDDVGEKYAVVMAEVRKKELAGQELTAAERDMVMPVRYRLITYQNELNTRIRDAFSKAMQYSGPEGKKEIQKFNKAWNKKFKEEEAKIQKRIDNKEVIEEQEVYKFQKRMYGDLFYQLASKKTPTPQMFVPIEDFAVKKASQTFGEVAYKAYKDFKEHTPVISVENWNPNMAFGRADQLKRLIKESRKKFVKSAMKDGVGESKAEEMAEKIIGSTWDVGHIYQLRKAGYKESEAIKETEKIAPFVKHVHLTDNFGFTDAHLAPGMGSIPIKKMMDKLKDSGYNKEAIVEAGNFVANFKTSAHPYALEALNSPVYYPGTEGPSWGAARSMGGGYSSYGMFLPEQHFSMYGGGFSGLPPELGGGAPGKGQRFSGAPME
ncbi:TIM barrel protein [Nanoarchaeota archaeon]